VTAPAAGGRPVSGERWPAGALGFDPDALLARLSTSAGSAPESAKATEGPPALPAEPEPVALDGDASEHATPPDGDRLSDHDAFASVVMALEAAGLEPASVEVYQNGDPRLARPRRLAGDGGAAWQAQWSAPSPVRGRPT
jgi:hypothetical protein